MKIVNGYSGSEHVTAAMDGALYAGVFGSGNYVVDVGKRLEAVMSDANHVQVSDGDLIMGGRHGIIAQGKTDTLTVDSGQTGWKRNDLVTARYTLNTQTSIETINLVVLKGAKTQGTPADPTYNKRSILEGATTADFPLYRIALDGINPKLEKLFTVAKPLEALATATEQTKWSEVWVTGDGRIDARVCRVGDIVYFLASCYDGFSVSTDLNNPASFTTLPTWARPKNVWRAPIMYISDNQMAYAIFKPDGLVQLAGFSESRYWYICTSYPAI